MTRFGRVRRHGCEHGPSETADAIGRRISDALQAACHPRPRATASVAGMGQIAVLVPRHSMARSSVAVGLPPVALAKSAVDVDALVARLYEDEGRRLVRLARLFVDDRNAAEDLVQEAFIRLAHNAHRINDDSKAAAYLRSIVLNLVRDQNRRGLVSLRHHLPFDEARASTEDEIVLRGDQREVIEALRVLPHRQRDCLVLRYYEELGIDDIATTLAISRNSVKTHLKRGLAALEGRLSATRPGSEIAEMVQ